MGKVFTEMEFDDWVRYLFDHPVMEPAWYWDIEADSVELAAEVTVEYARQLFERGGELIAGYSDAEANQGLWFLVSETNSMLYALGDIKVPIGERLARIKAISELFEECFARRCTPHLSHIDEQGAGALNGVCYMWWDIFPLYGKPEESARSRIDAECLSVMERTLGVPSIACQESALHGLGHWKLYYPERCEGIVSAYLARSPSLRPELREYAECAAKGMVQ